jgi:hypothetical protein
MVIRFFCKNSFLRKEKDLVIFQLDVVHNWPKLLQKSMDEKSSPSATHRSPLSFISHKMVLSGFRGWEGLEIVHAYLRCLMKCYQLTSSLLPSVRRRLCSPTTNQSSRRQFSTSRISNKVRFEHAGVGYCPFIRSCSPEARLSVDTRRSHARFSACV